MEQEKVKTKDNDLGVLSSYLVELIIKEMTPGLENNTGLKLDHYKVDLDKKELTRLLIERFNEEIELKKHINNEIFDFCYSLLRSTEIRLNDLLFHVDTFKKPNT